MGEKVGYNLYAVCFRPFLDPPEVSVNDLCGPWTVGCFGDGPAEAFYRKCIDLIQDNDVCDACVVEVTPAGGLTLLLLWGRHTINMAHNSLNVKFPAYRMVNEICKLYASARADENGKPSTDKDGGVYLGGHSE